MRSSLKIDAAEWETRTVIAYGANDFQLVLFGKQLPPDWSIRWTLHEAGLRLSLVKPLTPSSKKERVGFHLVVAEKKFPITRFKVQRTVGHEKKTFNLRGRWDIETVPVRVIFETLLAGDACEALSLAGKKLSSLRFEINGAQLVMDRTFASHVGREFEEDDIGMDDDEKEFWLVDLQENKR